ncbi:hypothetical protein RDABS01_011441 [Bienertia sinuspersici]
MQNLGLAPSSCTYDGLVKATIHHGGIGDTLELLKVMQSKNLKPCDSTLSTLSICCSKELHLDLAEALLNEIASIVVLFRTMLFLEHSWSSRKHGDSSLAMVPVLGRLRYGAGADSAKKRPRDVLVMVGTAMSW